MKEKQYVQLRSNGGLLMVFRRDQPFVQSSTFDGPYNLTELLSAAADIYSGYVFWTILTSLGISVWYFPLWHMGLSGYEALLMVTISPLVLGSAAIRRLVIRNLQAFHLASLAGLLAFLVKDPASRYFYSLFCSNGAMPGLVCEFVFQAWKPRSTSSKDDGLGYRVDTVKHSQIREPEHESIVADIELDEWRLELHWTDSGDTCRLVFVSTCGGCSNGAPSGKAKRLQRSCRTRIRWSDICDALTLYRLKVQQFCGYGMDILSQDLLLCHTARLLS